MKVLKVIAALAVLTCSVSCEDNSGYKYNYGSLPETPVNLADFNTPYDDYNSTGPSIRELVPFCFSTNRNSSGVEFDVIYQPMDVDFDKTSGVLEVTKTRAGEWEVLEPEYRVIREAITKIQTTGNEFGPNLMVEDLFIDSKFTLMYSTDVTGNSQINYVSNHKEEGFSEPREVGFLNSEFDDMYPTFNTDRSKIYFCSNRAGNFDFYYVSVNPEMDNDSILSGSTSHEVLRETSLCSASDDKCPFVFMDRMVFASNRAGGYGGFDLYYSDLVNGVWSAPVNFGAKINSQYDEYRPILIHEGVARAQTMMIFSSDRVGGKGGFDLYFVGISGNEREVIRG